MKPDVATIGILGVIGYLLSTRGASAVPGSTAGGVHLPGATPSTTPKPSGGSGSGSSGGGSGGGPSSGGGGGSVSKNPPQVYVCADGSLVSDPSLCPTVPGAGNGGECADSTYMDDISMCPENQPQVYDSGEPCDPNSAAYDPSQCGSPTTPNTYDSMDPCDPTSSYYEPSECYDLNSYAAPVTASDSYDPCDPSSVAYDEYKCGVLQDGDLTYYY